MEKLHQDILDFLIQISRDVLTEIMNNEKNRISWADFFTDKNLSLIDSRQKYSWLELYSMYREGDSSITANAYGHALSKLEHDKLFKYFGRDFNLLPSRFAHPFGIDTLKYDLFLSPLFKKEFCISVLSKFFGREYLIDDFRLMDKYNFLLEMAQDDLILYDYLFGGTMPGER